MFASREPSSIRCVRSHRNWRSRYSLPAAIQKVSPAMAIGRCVGKRFRSRKRSTRYVTWRSPTAAATATSWWTRSCYPTAKSRLRIEPKRSPRCRRRGELEASIPTEIFGRISYEDVPHNLRVHERGNHLNLGQEVPRRFLQILDGENSGAILEGQRTYGIGRSADAPSQSAARACDGESHLEASFRRRFGSEPSTTSARPGTGHRIRSCWIISLRSSSVAAGR